MAPSASVATDSGGAAGAQVGGEVLAAGGYELGEGDEQRCQGSEDHGSSGSLNRFVDQLNSDPGEAEPAGHEVFEVFSGPVWRRLADAAERDAGCLSRLPVPPNSVGGSRLDPHPVLRGGEPARLSLAPGPEGALSSIQALRSGLDVCARQGRKCEFFQYH